MFQSPELATMMILPYGTLSKLFSDSAQTLLFTRTFAESTLPLGRDV